MQFHFLRANRDRIYRVNIYLQYIIITTYTAIDKQKANTRMTIHVLGQYFKHNTCIVLQYMYYVTSLQYVPSFIFTGNITQLI
jgi:hypothetical protein